MFGFGTLAAAEPPATGSDPYVLRAKYLLNFALFVGWPAQTFEDANTPITIIVMGEDRVADEMVKILEGKKIQNRPVLIQRVRSGEPIEKCHLLYIGASENGRLDKLLAACKDKPVLTIGEGVPVFRSGGMVHFLIVDDAVRFNIDLDTAEKAGLQIRAPMLKAAYKVTSTRHVNK